MAELERQKEELVNRVDGWPEERLVFRPAPASWTVPEIFDHLAKSEHEIVAAARQGLQKPHQIGLRDRAGVFFIDRVFRSDRRVKVPASVTSILPASGHSLAEVLERWTRERAATAAFVAKVPAERVRDGIFRHPVAGWMNLADVLNFFSVHMIHHGFQITRLEEAFAEASRQSS